MRDRNIDLASFKNPRLVSVENEALAIRDDEKWGDLTSWPGAQPEVFIEEAAKSYEREARIIHLRNRIEGSLLAVMSSIVVITAIQEYVESENPLYLLGVPAGMAGGVFGLRMPNNRSTLEVQAAYRQDAETIRQMPRQIFPE
jgi:hypothetical protein